MGIKEKFIKDSTDVLKKMHPEWKRSQIESALERIWKQRLEDPSIIMDNNVKNITGQIKLTELCDYLDNKKPVIAGNATFYMQPTELVSPTSMMLRSMKKERKQVKAELAKYKPTDYEYQNCDLTQQNIKVIMNAEYGGSGTPTAAFYTKYSPAATTLEAQSIITMMAAMFEGYVGDNQVFFGINECFDWMTVVCNKTKTTKLPKWITIPTANEVSNRIKRKFLRGCITSQGLETVDRYINHCNDEELAFLFYANNLKSLISNHDKLIMLLHNIMTNLPHYDIAIKEVPDFAKAQFPNPDDGIEKYNKWIANEMFFNPYSIPKVIKADMDEFISIMTDMIYVEYIAPDSIIKLNNHKRNTVLLVDTDSNIINTDLFVQFVLKELFPGETFGRPTMYNEMILVNVICATLSPSVALELDYFGRMHNMDSEARKELTMKNEFMFRVLFLMLVKKRYVASIVLREGNIIIPFKPEIKGVDFIKAGVSDEVSKRFKDMLCNHILFSEQLEAHELIKELKQFEREINNDLHQGKMSYLKHAQFKQVSAYAKPWTQQAFKGAMVWNAIYEDNQIYPLDRISILKTTISDLSDLEDLKLSHPDIYNKIVSNIFMSTNDPELRRAGMKIVAIPNTEKQIPEWLIPYIDYDLIISDTIASFKSILKALGIEEINFKTPNGKASITSGIISM